jgi:hypothetical protein
VLAAEAAGGGVAGLPGRARSSTGAFDCISVTTAMTMASDATVPKISVPPPSR